MGTFRKRGDVWRAEVSKSGIRESKTFGTKREAQEWAARRESEISGVSVAGLIPKTLQAVLERYRDEVAVSHKGSRWEEVRLNKFLRDEKTLCAKHIHQITPDELADWRDRRGAEVKQASVRRDIALLRTAWRYARKEWRNVREDPWSQIHIPPKGKNRERIYTQDEIDRIVLALGYVPGQPPRDKRAQTGVAFLLAIETAMRSGELIGLEWADVDLKSRVARLHDTKNGDRREVPLSTAAARLFEDLKGLDPVRVFTLTDGLRDAYFRSGRTLAQVEGATFHDARATALTRLSKKLSVLELARMVGHRDPRSLMIYYRESAADIAKKLD